MKKSKKLEPQSWESAYGWLSTLTATPNDANAPVLQNIVVQDGRAYATNAYILGSAACPEVCPWGTLLPNQKALDSELALTTPITSYPDVQRLLERHWGQDLVIDTEDLILALKKAVVLLKNTASIDQDTLLIFNRELGVVYVYAEDHHGAALNVVLTGTGSITTTFPTIAGCWVDASALLTVLKGWSKGKHGWPDAKGSHKTLIQFAVRHMPDGWSASVIYLTPFTEGQANDSPFIKPFALVMSRQGNNNLKLASLAWEKAQSAQTAYDFKAKLKGSRTTWNHWKGQLDLNDLPLFQDVPPFKLGSGNTIRQWKDEKFAEVLERSGRVNHNTAMRNHPAMIPWYNLPHSEHPRIAEGKEETEQLIAAIKESQKP